MVHKATLVVADDHPIFAEALAHSLAARYEVLATITRLDRVIEVVREHRPAVLLLDLSFGKASALPLIPGILMACPETRIVVLTVHLERILAQAAIKAGAGAFVVKQSAPAELYQAIDAAIEGRSFMTGILKSLRTLSVNAIGREVGVSEVERRILADLRCGLTQEQAAANAQMTSKGVEYHLKKLRGALGLSTTAQLLLWAESLESGS